MPTEMKTMMMMAMLMGRFDNEAGGMPPQDLAGDGEERSTGSH